MPTSTPVANTITTFKQGLDQRLVLYFHIPFCRARCTYCAFNTYTGQTRLIPVYVHALLREVNLVAGQNRRPVHTLYFGGGTPSLLPGPAVEAILERCAGAFALASEAEITLEANPGTVEPSALYHLRQAGVNRLSIGMQSAHAGELQLFSRIHSIDDVRSMVKMARAAGFDNISLDLIYGIPRQTLKMWQHSLETALDMTPTHLSLYSLGIEDGTPLQRQIARGALPVPDSDRAADMVEWAAVRLADAGFEQYEISNWAKPGFACRHNVHVWRNLPYLGLGAGAHGYAAGVRYANVDHPAAYIDRIQAQTVPRPFPLSAAADMIETIDEQAGMAETMIMGLRLTHEGVVLETFRARFGHELWDVYGSELDRLIACGLVECTADGHVRLTPRGRLLGNHVFVAFV